VANGSADWVSGGLGVACCRISLVMWDCEPELSYAHARHAVFFSKLGGDDCIQRSLVLVRITNPPLSDDERTSELSVSVGNDWVYGVNEMYIGQCHQSGRDNSIPRYERTEPECRPSVYVALKS
jgi:hypothetical protein